MSQDLAAAKTISAKTPPHASERAPQRLSLLPSVFLSKNGIATGNNLLSQCLYQVDVTTNRWRKGGSTSLFVLDVPGKWYVGQCKNSNVCSVRNYFCSRVIFVFWVISFCLHNFSFCRSICNKIDGLFNVKVATFSFCYLSVAQFLFLCLESCFSQVSFSFFLLSGSKLILDACDFCYGRILGFEKKYLCADNEKESAVAKLNKPHCITREPTTLLDKICHVESA